MRTGTTIEVSGLMGLISDASDPLKGISDVALRVVDTKQQYGLL